MDALSLCHENTAGPCGLTLPASIFSTPTTPHLPDTLEPKRVNLSPYNNAESRVKTNPEGRAGGSWT